MLAYTLVLADRKRANRVGQGNVDSSIAIQLVRALTVGEMRGVKAAHSVARPNN